MRIISILTAALLVLGTSSVSFANSFVLIVNKENSISRLTKQDARRIFLGKQMTWPNKNLITMITQSNSEVHTHFIRTIIRQTSHEYDKYWKRLLHTGRGIPPKLVATDDEVKAVVSANVNAIGYIDKRSLDRSVKMVKLH